MAILANEPIYTFVVQNIPRKQRGAKVYKSVKQFLASSPSPHTSTISTLSISTPTHFSSTSHYYFTYIAIWTCLHMSCIDDWDNPRDSKIVKVVISIYGLRVLEFRFLTRPGICYMIVYLTNQILLVESTVILCSDFHVA
jgi:hypothetical protein